MDTGWSSRSNRATLAAQALSQQKGSERRHWGMTANGRVDLPQPASLPQLSLSSLSCLVLSCELHRIHFMCDWTNHHRVATAAPRPEASSSWLFLVLLSKGLRLSRLKPGSDDAMSISHRLLTCATYTHRGEGRHTATMT